MNNILIVKISEISKYRKEFIEIDDSIEYKRCRVQLHKRGVVLRDKISGVNIKTKKQRLCKKNDFIVAEMDAKFGGYGIIPEDLENAIVSSHYYLYELDKKKIIPDYLSVLIDTDVIQNQIKAQGSTNYSRVSPSEVLDFEIPCPTIQEQKKIINFYLNSKNILLQLNSESDTQLTHLSLLRQSILQEAIEGKLTEAWRKQNSAISANFAREKKGALAKGAEDAEKNEFSDASVLLEKIKAEKLKMIGEGKIRKEKPLAPIKPEEVPFELPEGWVWCRLGMINNIKSGKRIHASDYKKEGIPFLRSGEIGSLGRGDLLKEQLFISKEKYFEIKEKFGIPSPGDILIACIGGSIGNTWVIDEREFYYKDGNLVLIEQNNSTAIPYLLSYLKTPLFWNKTILNATDTSYNALTIEKLNEAMFPLPPLAEQQAIVVRIDRLLAMVDELEKQVEERKGQSEELMQAVLREAFEGNSHTESAEGAKKMIS